MSPRQRRINLGRGENADIRLNGDTVSRNHAQLTVDGDGLLKLVDIDSRNGTFVNGVMVHSEVLRDGDRVAFGGDVVVDVRYGHASSGGPANVPNLSFSDQGKQPVDLWHIHTPSSDRIEHTVQSYERTLELRTRRAGEFHPSLAPVLDVLGVLHRIEGRPEMAVDAHRRALQIQKATPYVSQPELGQSYVRLARAELGCGDTMPAGESLEMAASLLTPAACQPGERSDYAIAMACLALQHDPRRFESAVYDARQEIAKIASVDLFHNAKKECLTSELEALASGPTTRRAMS